MYDLMGFVNLVWVVSNRLMFTMPPRRSSTGNRLVRQSHVDSRSSLWSPLVGYLPMSGKRSIEFPSRVSMPITWHPNPMIQSSCGSDCIFVPKFSSQQYREYQGGWIPLGWTHFDHIISESYPSTSPSILVSTLYVRIAGLAESLYRDIDSMTLDYVVHKTSENSYCALFVGLGAEGKTLVFRECDILPYPQHGIFSNSLSSEYYIHEVNTYSMPISQARPSIVRIIMDDFSATAGIMRVSCLLGGYENVNHRGDLGFVTANLATLDVHQVPNFFRCNWIDPKFGIASIQKRALARGFEVMSDGSRRIPLIVVSATSSQALNIYYREKEEAHFDISASLASKNTPHDIANQVGMIREKEERDKFGGALYELLHVPLRPIEEGPRVPVVFLNSGTVTAFSSVKIPVLLVSISGRTEYEELAQDPDQPMAISSTTTTRRILAEYPAPELALLEVSEPLRFYFEPVSEIIYFFSSYGLGCAAVTGKYAVKSLVLLHQ
jgi:hypothetical protein